MHLSTKPDSFLDLFALKTGLAPRPMMDTQIAMIVARAIITATDTGIFDDLALNAKTAEEVAISCRLNLNATRSLLGLLTSTVYMTYHDGLFSLTKAAKKWLVTSSPESLRDIIVFNKTVWNWLSGLENFVRNNESVHPHENISDEYWSAYQKAMLALARGCAKEVGLRTRVPKNSVKMLDIGGSHGLFSAEICRSHASLKSTILELPEAVVQWKINHPLPERIDYLAGDALTIDLGENQYDLVFISNLLHHFNELENKLLCERVARSLKLNGIFIIQEFVRPQAPESRNQVGQSLDLFFALTSKSGTWSIDELASWQKSAGLANKKPVFLRSIPGFVQIVSEKKF